jgi:glycosyltransferase involved in cell wall biosynthesis
MTRKSLRVVHYYARYLAHPSGVTDSLNHWAQASMRAGDTVRILSAPRRGRDSNEFALRAETRQIRHLGWGRGTWIPLGLYGALRNADLLVLHEGWVLSNFVAALIARVRNVPYVVMPHGVYERQIVNNQRDVSSIRARLDRWILRRAAAVHVFYAGETQVIAEFEPRIANFIVVPNGAEPLSIEATWRGDGDYFLWMGRFDVFHKGLDNLLGYWAKLPEPRPNLRLVGPNFMDGRERIARLVSELGLAESVTLHGRVSGEEKDRLLAECRAYLHPSRWESCSIMLLEALSAGVPALVSSTIHAASELEPLGILRSTRFGEVDADIRVLAEVDRNSDIGNRAGVWSGTAGRWTEVGVQMIERQTELGLRNKGGLFK